MSFVAWAVTLSVFSLQGLDAVCFIAGVLANDLDAVIEASKLELLVQLDGKLVDFDVGGGRLGEDALDLDGDGGADGLALGAAEGEHDFVLLVVVGDHVLGHGNRHLDGGGGLSSNLLLDGQAEDLDGHLVAWLLVGEGQRAATLPWPVRVVEDVQLDDLGHAGGNLEGLLGLARANGTSLFPAMLSSEVLPVLFRPSLEVFLHEYLFYFLYKFLVPAVALLLMHMRMQMQMLA